MIGTPCPVCKQRLTDGLCIYRDAVWHKEKEKEMSNTNIHVKHEQNEDKAKRNPVDVRYDVIYAAFTRMMAKIGAVGAAKYGDFNWHKSRLTGVNDPVNHLHKHLTSYELQEPYDHKEIGVDYKIHLAAIAFNAMMEFWYCENWIEPTKIEQVGE